MKSRIAFDKFYIERTYILEANWIQIHLQVGHTIWVRPVKSNGQLHWRENSTETRWNVQREETAQWSRLYWSQRRHEECFSIRSFPGEIRVAEATAVWFLIYASCKVGLSVFFKSSLYSAPQCKRPSGKSFVGVGPDACRTHAWQKAKILHSGCHQSVKVLEDDFVKNAADDHSHRFFSNQWSGFRASCFPFSSLESGLSFFGKLHQEMPQRQGSCRLHNWTTVKLHLIFVTLLLYIVCLDLEQCLGHRRSLCPNAFFACLLHIFFRPTQTWMNFRDTCILLLVGQKTNSFVCKEQELEHCFRSFCKTALGPEGLRTSKEIVWKSSEHSPSVSIFVLFCQRSLNYPFWRNQTVQICGNFAGFPL